MTEHKTAQADNLSDSIAFAVLPENIVVIRVTGRGSFQNSMELRKVADAMFARPAGQATRFIFDLGECVTMDSTFMGVLASIGLKQLRSTGEKLTTLNTNPQNVRLLSTLGLSQFIVVREADDSQKQLTEEDFQSMIREDASRRERIVHMIEAHRQLCDADPSNNLKFESVLKYLEDSLVQESD